MFIFLRSSILYLKMFLQIANFPSTFLHVGCINLIFINNLLPQTILSKVFDITICYYRIQQYSVTYLFVVNFCGKNSFYWSFKPLNVSIIMNVSRLDHLEFDNRLCRDMFNVHKSNLLYDIKSLFLPFHVANMK